LIIASYGRFFLTDIRVSKYIKFDYTAKLGLFFEAFNLFDTLNPGNSFSATASNKDLFKVINGFIGGAGNPFQAQFGARFSSQWTTLMICIVFGLIEV